MLKNSITCPVDELYLNIINNRQVSRIGVNNGVFVDPAIYPPSALVPRGPVRIIGYLQNAPLVLAAEKTYMQPIEIASLRYIGTVAYTSVQEMVTHTRNMHRSLPDHHPLRYRKIQNIDKYSYGLTYDTLVARMSVAEYKFSAEDVDFDVDVKYIHDARSKHIMSDLFTCEHVADVCAALVDPRLCMTGVGAFDYPGLIRTFGFGSLELLCEFVGKIIKLHGTGPLPNSATAIHQLANKVTGNPGTAVSTPLQLLVIKAVHGILTSPLDNLGVTLKRGTTRLFRDAEVVRQRLHIIIDEWLCRLYGDTWNRDGYTPDMFEYPEEEEEDEYV